MKAIRHTGVTTLGAVHVMDVYPTPPRADEVQVRLHAAAINHRDLWLLAGKIQEPFTLGADGAGVIEAVGAHVTGWQRGDAVIINPALAWGTRDDTYSGDFAILGSPQHDGTFAELITIAAESVYARPPHLSVAEAAALPLAGVTAYRALVSRAQVQPGEQVLIHGIGGGVAQAALQFALALGVRVAVTSTSDAKLTRAKFMGAELGVNTHAKGWQDTIRAWTQGRGVDVVLESIGGEMFVASLRVLRPGGRIVTYGTTGQDTATIDLSDVFWSQFLILGSTLGSPHDFAQMLALVNQHAIKPILDATFALPHIHSAFERMRERHQFGKIVVQIAEER